MIYFIEDVPGDFRVNEHDLLIALTPMACYDLGKKGFCYKVPEDFYDESSIKEGEDEYFLEQIKWFKKLDDLVDDIVPLREEAHIGIVWLYYYFLKQTIDNPIVYLRRLERILQESENDKIVYVSRDKSRDPKGLRSDLTLVHTGNLMYKTLVPLYCSERNIPYKMVDISDDYEVKEAGRFFRNKGVWNLAKRFICKNSHLRTLGSRAKLFVQLFDPNQIADLKRSCIRKRNPKRMTMLFFSMGCGLNCIAMEALKRGHRVIIRDENRFYEHTGVSLRCVYQLPDYDNSLPGKYWEIMKKTPEFKTEILSWIQGESVCDISCIIEDRLEIFLDRVCPAIVFYHKVYLDFINREEINYIIAPSLWWPNDFSAMSAAKASKFTKGILSQHGGGEVFDNYFSIMVRLGVVDIFMSYSQELIEHYEKKRQLIPVGLAGQVLNQYYTSNFAGKITKARRKYKNTNKKETVVYFPTFINYFASRFNGVEYRPIWYYKHQLRLLEYFAKKTEFNFIWKGRTISDDSANPIPLHIKEKHFSNISVSDRGLVEHLLTADRVITDFGASAFWQAVTAKIPTMCISHKSVKTRSSAKDFLGKLYQEFIDFDEVIEKLDEFLGSDPKQYIRDLPEAETDLLTELELLATDGRH